MLKIIMETYAVALLTLINLLPSTLCIYVLMRTYYYGL